MDPKLSRAGLAQDHKQNLARNLTLELKLWAKRLWTCLTTSLDFASVFSKATNICGLLLSDTAMPTENIFLSACHTLASMPAAVTLMRPPIPFSSFYPLLLATLTKLGDEPSRHSWAVYRSDLQELTVYLEMKEKGLQPKTLTTREKRGRICIGWVV